MLCTEDGPSVISCRGWHSIETAGEDEQMHCLSSLAVFLFLEDFMTRDLTFMLRLSTPEKQLITDLAETMKRSQADALRVACRLAARELGLLGNRASHGAVPLRLQSDISSHAATLGQALLIRRACEAIAEQAASELVGLETPSAHRAPAVEIDASSATDSRQIKQSKGANN
jgi:hypothetical protein